jgi:hypothetical protein
VDEIINSETQAQITSQIQRGFFFLAIEHDRLVVPAVAAADSVVQSISQNVGGFNNKTVNRILVVTSSTNGGAIGADNTRGFCLGGAIGADITRELGSCSHLNQKVQVRITGSNVFPRDGITGPNQRRALLNSVWGGCDSFIDSNKIYLSNAANCVGATGMI